MCNLRQAVQMCWLEQSESAEVSTRHEMSVNLPY